MPAHLREIHILTCSRCSAKATKVLHNSQNAVINEFCSKHAPAALREQQRRDVEDALRNGGPAGGFCDGG